MRAFFSVVLLFALLLPALLVACGDDDDAGPVTAPPGAAGVDLVYREVQCLGNPWERDWLASHPGEQYPSDEPARRVIFESYWRSQGIAVSDVRYEATPGVDAVCAGCNCPTGFEWRVRVPSDQASAALARGFQRA